jgi:hypothetical protein
MNIVFYPEMGIDIVAPLMGIPKVNKIYTLGPVPSKRFGNKQCVDKTMNYISKLVEYGDTRFDRDQTENGEIVEFFPDIGDRLKSYNFKTKKMWTSQFRTHDSNIVTLNYYYDARINDDKLPFSEKVDYIVHKDFDFTDHLKKLIKPILKPTTQLIAPEDELSGYWKVPENILDDLELIDTYNINNDADQDLYCVNINEYL